MATMNVSLPDPMKEWVEAQVRAGQYGNASEYVRDLIRHDQEYRQKQERLREAIHAGLDSGVSNRTPKEILASAKAKFQNAD